MATTINRRPGKAQTLPSLFPKFKKVLVATSVTIGIVLTIAILIAIFSPSPPPPAKVVYQKFHLPACNDGECEEMPTVDAGPGTLHRLRGNAPYQAISVQPNGERVIYNMPEGWESWTGAAPAGKLRLMNAKGAKHEVLVEIIRVR